eukprot:366374-Lingulodinium_polyedra.AAC.1
MMGKRLGHGARIHVPEEPLKYHHGLNHAEHGQMIFGLNRGAELWAAHGGRRLSDRLLAVLRE